MPNAAEPDAGLTHRVAFSSPEPVKSASTSHLCVPLSSDQSPVFSNPE
jgi:hypothetical protein